MVFIAWIVTSLVWPLKSSTKLLCANVRFFPIGVCDRLCSREVMIIKQESSDPRPQPEISLIWTLSVFSCAVGGMRRYKKYCATGEASDALEVMV